MSFNGPCSMIIILHLKLATRGSGGDSVGRAVTFDSRGPQFESSHRKKLYWISTVNCIEKTKVMKKGREWLILKNSRNNLVGPDWALFESSWWQFSYKSRQNIWHPYGPFWKSSPWRKNLIWLFFDYFWQIWLLFIPTYLVTLLDKMQWLIDLRTSHCKKQVLKSNKTTLNLSKSGPSIMHKLLILTYILRHCLEPKIGRSLYGCLLFELFRFSSFSTKYK